jgi:hypothetical protein
VTADEGCPYGAAVGHRPSVIVLGYPIAGKRTDTMNQVDPGTFHWLVPGERKLPTRRGWQR